MNKYDYLEAVTDDVRRYIRENVVLAEWKGNRGGLEEELNNVLWTEDSVTGNASGSYYCNSRRANKALSHNRDLLAEALREFGLDDVGIPERGAEAADVIVRCYLLGQAIARVLDELEEELAEEEE